MNPNFTEEELLYIENLFDLNASICGDKIIKACEMFIFEKTAGNEPHCKMISEVIMEHGRAQLVTKSIRDKIENWRKNR